MKNRNFQQILSDEKNLNESKGKCGCIEGFFENKQPECEGNSLVKFRKKRS